MKQTVESNIGPAYYIAIIVALVMVNYQLIVMKLFKILISSS